MFQRFTEGARELVLAAQVEARALGDGHIGTEHLLLGAAAAPGAVARVLADNGATTDSLRTALHSDRAIDGEALATLGIDLDEIRRRVEESFGPGALERRRPARAGHIPFTAHAKKALELALRESLARGDRHIGPQHVLLGALRDDHATAVLRRAGADPERVREALSPAGSRRGRGG